MATVLGVTHSPPRFRVPDGACDCHTHVFGPHARYPLAGERLFTPPEAGVADLRALQDALGLTRVVLVQPSAYGTDNACLLASLAALGGRARGVAVIGRDTDDAMLPAMHAAGVRAVRVNLATRGEGDVEVARAAVAEAARRVAPLGWHVEVHAAASVWAALVRHASRLPARLVADHFGRLDPAAPEGWTPLLELVAAGTIFVKLSAAYRLARRADLSDVADLAKAFASAGPMRIVWGSDWPHVGTGPREGRRPDVIEPFGAVDDGTGLNAVAAWLPDDATRHRLLVANPAALYGFDP
ncbi:amidohydrolase family protein [Acuticoccus sp.]|uniref:amidohydrolase family protein n=1 Tax=Acuticoccus sp. TaxID=1904378 RepID=UPI003B52EE45